VTGAFGSANAVSDNGTVVNSLPLDQMDVLRVDLQCEQAGIFALNLDHLQPSQLCISADACRV
jgi:hypothetical protein